MRFPHVLLVAVLMAAGCKKDSPHSKVSGDPATLTYSHSLGVDLATMQHSPTGLYLKDLQVGDGPEAKAGQTAVVQYTGWLADGTKFDSSRDSGEPFKFALGAGEVIPGWDEGVAGMKVHGRRLLVIPSALGYGSAGAGGAIPPDAVLVFEVELVGVE